MAANPVRARVVGVVLAALLVGACAARADSPMSSSPTPSSSPADAQDASAGVAHGRPIVLPRLPELGVAAERGSAVVFVDLQGRVVARLRGFELYYEWTVPGQVILRQNRREFFVLHVRSHSLVPMSRDKAFTVAPQFEAGFGPDADPGLPYPAGTRVEGHPDLRAGFWAYALPSPDGSRLLAQWSGECEVPNAFFIDDGRAVTVDGHRQISRAAESTALGWTPDGRAVAVVSGGPCSSGFARAGVYIIDEPGNGELLFAADGRARMWGAA